MTFKEIQELIKLVNKSNLAEFKLEQGDLKITIRTAVYAEAKNQPATVTTVPQMVSLPAPPPQGVSAPATAAPAAPAETGPAAESPQSPKPAPADESRYVPIKSPMVGTFYRSASPDKPPYVEVGSHVKKGDVVCIIEAMKLFNEIESEVSGTIVKVMVENESPVEYDQVLFLVDPD
ncbi:MAG: acetyl-CoA carboxylase, biotin carboxyl carrier protein [Saprospiraceae bacterium]|nr:MAG: acetyl-CoA carboxylase, biotin carboxyl carrier protein [Saprospiraceae bacterium]